MEVWQTSNLRPLRLGEEKRRRKNKRQDEKIYMVCPITQATKNNKIFISIPPYGCKFRCIAHKAPINQMKLIHHKQSLMTMFVVSWYHATATRHVAESLLMQNGTDGSFLLRPSMSRPGHLTVSVRYAPAWPRVLQWGAGLSEWMESGEGPHIIYIYVYSPRR